MKKEMILYQDHANNHMRILFITNFIAMVIIAIAISSCKMACSTDANNAKMDTIDIDNAYYTNKILFSDFSSHPQVIVLETSKQSIIQQIKTIDIYNKQIYILDDKRDVLVVFDMNGNYKFSVGEKGNGRGEYLEAADFAIDRIKQEVYVMDDAMDRINRYDANTGKFISSIQTTRDGHRSYNMAYTNGNIYLSHSSLERSDDNCEIIQLDTITGEIKNRHINSSEYNNGWNLPLQIESSMFYCKNTDNPKFMGLFSNHVFSIDKEGVAPCLYIKNDKFANKDEIDELIKKFEKNNHVYDFSSLRDGDKAYMNSNLCEFGPFYYFQYQQGFGGRHVLYNTDSKETIVTHSICNDYISSKVPFPMKIILGGDSCFVGIMTTNSIPQFNSHIVAKGLLNNELQNYNKLKTVKDEDNPILFVHKIKEKKKNILVQCHARPRRYE